MELVVSILKYIFVVGVVVEIALILRALFTLARDRAGEATQSSGLSGIEGAAPAEE